MSEKEPQGFEPLLAGIGRSRAWRFFARNRLLCLLIAIGILCILDQRHAETKIVAVIALIGSVFCLKKFALDRCIWIYLLAMLIYPCIAIVAYEAALRVQTDWQITAFPLHAIYLVCSSFLGLLPAVPCSLFFIKKFNKISELWKVPLCVFFLISALHPFYLLIFYCLGGLFITNC